MDINQTIYRDDAWVVNADPIRVACSRNYRDTTLTAGTLLCGGGRETLTVDVRVEPVESSRAPADCPDA